MLYIVGTPIGNLDDLSIRQAKTLTSSDIILTEDTRSAKILLEAITVKFGYLPNKDQRIISYYREKEFDKLPAIIEYLTNGKNISLISESGMPLISDPGYLLLNTVIKKGLSYTVIPGGSSVTAALVASGFNPEKFFFLGFLPKKTTHRIRLISQIRLIKKLFLDTVFIFFESPKRINETLEIITNILPNADICICREMTKMFEEFIRGKAKDLMQKTYKGELTIVLE